VFFGDGAQVGSLAPGVTHIRVGIDDQFDALASHRISKKGMREL
jgi:hypothetical protein